MAILEFVIAVIVCSITFCAYKVYKLQTYWSSRGVPHIKPKLLVGNIVENGKKPFFWHYRQVYEKLKDRKAPFVGFHFFLMPFAFIMDLDLVKNILIKDFNNFVDRGMYVNEKDDPLSGHLFSLDGERWRTMRHKLTTTFTSGKMKFMFPTVVEVSKQFSEAFATIVAEDPIVEIKDLLSRFTTDVIGRCAFGIECNSLKDPSAEFRTKGRQFFTDRRHNFIVQTLMIAFPKFAQKLGMKIIPDHVHDFFMGMVKETVKYREENNIVKNDFLNLLLELKNNNETSLTIEEMAAQCFVFFVAGFETSSSTMGFCLYELALNQDIQEKVRTEILETLENHNGEFTYECMQDMKYLDQCVQGIHLIYLNNFVYIKIFFSRNSSKTLCFAPFVKSCIKGLQSRELQYGYRKGNNLFYSSRRHHA